MCLILFVLYTVSLDTDSCCVCYVVSLDTDSFVCVMQFPWIQIVLCVLCSFLGYRQFCVCYVVSLDTDSFVCVMQFPWIQIVVVCVVVSLDTDSFVCVMYRFLRYRQVLLCRWYSMVLIQRHTIHVISLVLCNLKDINQCALLYQIS